MVVIVGAMVCTFTGANVGGAMVGVVTLVVDVPSFVMAGNATCTEAAVGVASCLTVGVFSKTGLVIAAVVLTV